MIKKIKYPINRFALKLALFSLCFGILQLIIYSVYPNDISIDMGMIHLFPTVIIHTIVLCIVIINSIINYKDLPEHFVVILAMLANIPIAFGCFYTVLTIADL